MLSPDMAITLHNYMLYYLYEYIPKFSVTGKCWEHLKCNVVCDNFMVTQDF